MSICLLSFLAMSQDNEPAPHFWWHAAGVVQGHHKAEVKWNRHEALAEQCLQDQWEPWPWGRAQRHNPTVTARNQQHLFMSHDTKKGIQCRRNSYRRVAYSCFLRMSWPKKTVTTGIELPPCDCPFAFALKGSPYIMRVYQLAAILSVTSRTAYSSFNFQ